MEDKNILYGLDLHGSIYSQNNLFFITRVPGGWIYSREEPKSNLISTCFVPYVKENKNKVNI